MIYIEKYLRFKDGEERLLADMTQGEFTSTGLWVGSDDMAYARYKRSRGMSEMSDFADYDEYSGEVNGAKVIIKVNGKEISSFNELGIDFDY